MKKTKSIKILPFTIKQTIVLALAGLVAGLLYAGIGAVIDYMTVGFNKGTALAFLAIPVMPVYFAAFGFITGIVGASFYNWISGLFQK